VDELVDNLISELEKMPNSLKLVIEKAVWMILWWNLGR
jgi:hypothetical protein